LTVYTFGAKLFVPAEARGELFVPIASAHKKGQQRDGIYTSRQLHWG